MKKTKKLGIYSPYLDTLGGGELYLAGIAQVFADCDYHIDWWWPNATILTQISQRFGMDLKNSVVNSQAHSIQTQGTLLQKLQLHRSYDSLFFVSDGSLPTLFSRNNYVHMQVPFLEQPMSSITNFLKKLTIKSVICNSNFTKKIIDNTYSVNSKVLYPPVNQVEKKAKENLILSVGRFDSDMNSKRQDVLIEAFKTLNAADWRLVLAGGSLDQKQVKSLEQQIQNDSRISLLSNPSYKKIQDLYASAKIYWHAAGFGAAANQPYKAEHFGIAIVEAMSAGAIPLAYKMGGPKEIIDQAHNGYLWETTDQLVKLTRDLLYHQDKMSVMSPNATRKAMQFSKETFASSLKTIIS